MNGWRDELQRTADCIPMERLDEELTPREHSHLAHCTRCQTELALWKRMNEAGDDAEDVGAVAAEVRRRMASQQPSNVVAMPQRTPRRFAPSTLAAAAMLVLAVGLGVFLVQRPPSIETPGGATQEYRSAGVAVLEPAGDVDRAPQSLRWKAVDGATEYEVVVMEVDRNPLWRGSVRGPEAALPAALVAQFVPGKTILWQVQARRGTALAADSGVQRFRVRIHQ